MPQGDYSYVAYLNDQQVLASLLRIEKNMDSFGQRGEQAFDKVGGSANAFGGLMQGVVAGGAIAVTNALLNMAQQGVAAFGRLLESAVDSATQYDVMKRKFVAIFEGNEEVADAVMDHISEKAASMGMDINEALSMGRSFFPDVRETEDPVKQIDDLLVAAKALSEEDPFAGIIGARRAIDEAMSGNVRSIRDIFEFTKTEIDILKASQEELGPVVGTIEGINRVMQRRGVDIEAMKGSYTQSMSQISSAAKDLRTELGKPIASALADQLTDLNKWLKLNGDDLETFANGIGRVVGEVVDFIGTNLMDWLNSLDMEKLSELSDNLYDVIINIEDLLTVGHTVGDLFGLLLAPVKFIAETILGIEFTGDFLTDLNNVVDWFNQALEKAIKLKVTLSASDKGLEAQAEVLAKAIEGGEIRLDPTFGTQWEKDAAAAAVRGSRLIQETMMKDLQKRGEAGDKIAQALFEKASFTEMEVYTEEINKMTEALENSSKAKDKNREQTKQFRKEQEKDTSGVLEQLKGETALTEEQIKALERQMYAEERAAKAKREAYEEAISTEGPSQRAELLKKEAEAAEKVAAETRAIYEAATDIPEGRELLDEDQIKALDKAQEAIEKAQRDHQDRMIEDNIKFGEKMDEQDIKNAQKRVGMWEDLLFDIETIHIKHLQKLDDTYRDFDRDDAKMARKHAQERVDLAKDLAKERADIERDFIKTVQDIRSTFQQDVEDAEEAQDALAYLAAVKKRDRAIEEAKKERVDTQQETTLQGEERLAELQTQQQREREEARIDQQEKLEDLQRSLDREIEMRERNYEEQLRQQDIAEQRQFEQMQRAFQQQEEALNRSLQKRLRDIKAELDQEVRAVLEAEAAKQAAAARTIQSRLELDRALQDVKNRQIEEGRTVRLGGRQHGGPVSKDVPYMTGERGREIFIPAVDGAILPNQQTERVLAALTRGSAAATYSSNNFTQNLSLLNPAQLTPEQMAITAEQARRISLQTYHELFG